MIESALSELTDIELSKTIDRILEPSDNDGKYNIYASLLREASRRLAARRFTSFNDEQFNIQ